MTYHAIAIDGPAASGKSTMARSLAKRLGLIMVNSGAMYRAVTWKVLEEGIDPHQSSAVVNLLEKMNIVCGHDGMFSTIEIDGVNPEKFLREPRINENVSVVSAIPEVRDRLVALQRDYLKHTHVVMEGRDIGSVVFPDTPFKVYMDASAEVRNQRRSVDGEVDEVEKRDKADRSRATAPLVVANGAAVLDTSGLSIDGAIEAALEILKSQGFPIPYKGNAVEEVDPSRMMRWIYWVGWLFFGAAYRTIFGMRVIGAENLILTGPVLVASNHQSFLDPPLIGNLYKSEMVFFARKTLFRGVGKWLYPQWNAIPIDQDKPDMSSMKTVIRKLKEGWRVLVFPEGARTLDGEIAEAAAGVGMMVAKSGAPIQPVRIFGAHEALARGSSKIRFARITVKVGEPIYLTEEELKRYSVKGGYDELTRRIMDAIRAL